MPTLINTGEKIVEVDLVELLPADEGTIDQYYGRIGNGKTYAATADIVQDLKRGKVVYCNWHVQWQGYDQRTSLWHLFLGFIGLKKHYYKFDKENLHYFPIGEDFVEKLSALTDCIVYLDEGHLAFDSYEMAKMGIAKRAAVLHTRHFDRTIKIISQRPTAIHVTLRANVNRYFKCEKIWDRFGIKIFRKTEFQDLTGNEVVDESEEAIVSSKMYWGSKDIFKMYDTKYLRGDTPISQEINASIYKLKHSDIRANLKTTFRKKEKEKEIPIPRPPHKKTEFLETWQTQKQK